MLHNIISEESPVELDKFDRYSKFQKVNNEQRINQLDRQEKITYEKQLWMPWI
jgi:hypothetical protein